MKVTTKLLAQVSPRGKYLVVKLKTDHHQGECPTVPAGTVGVIKGGNIKVGYMFVFPHSVLPQDLKAFTDGHLRIVRLENVEILGRVG